jgi:hypothetical protein
MEYSEQDGVPYMPLQAEMLRTNLLAKIVQCGAMYRGTKLSIDTPYHRRLLWVAHEGFCV